MRRRSATEVSRRCSADQNPVCGGQYVLTTCKAESARRSASRAIPEVRQQDEQERGVFAPIGEKGGSSVPDGVARAEEVKERGELHSIAYDPSN
jgi:hypothetical protein